MGRLDWGDESSERASGDSWGESAPPKADQTVNVTYEPYAARDAVTPIRPPTVLLVAAGAVVALSIVLLPASQTVVRFGGYLLGTMVTIGLVAAFYREDLQRQQSSAYSPRAGLQAVAISLVLTGFVVAVIHVWRLARAWT